MKADLSVIGPAITLPRRISASTTRYEVGEPLHSVSTLSSGVASVNNYVLAAADTPTIGTHRFGGIAISRCLPLVNAGGSATLVAHTAQASCPIAGLSRLRGKTEVVANVATESALLGLIGDVTLIDYNATGGSDGGELYTIKETAGADTSGLEIVAGNVALGTLDVVVDPRSYRHDVS